MMIAKRMFVHTLIVGLFLYCAFGSYSIAAGACGSAGSLTIAGPDAPSDGSQYTASGGTPPYSWCISKGNITNNGVVTVSGYCGASTITVWDSCGNQGGKIVRMPLGTWGYLGRYYPSTTGPQCSTGSGWENTWNFCLIGTLTGSCFGYRPLWSMPQCARVGVGNPDWSWERIIENKKYVEVGAAWAACWGGQSLDELTDGVTKAIPDSTYGTPPTWSCGPITLEGVNAVYAYGGIRTYSAWSQSADIKTFRYRDTYEWWPLSTCNDSDNVCESLCNLTITKFNSNNTTIDPKLGQKIRFTGAISASPGKAVTWTIVISKWNAKDGSYAPVKVVDGSGTAPTLSWNGKNAAGKIESGQYQAVFTASVPGGSCPPISKSLRFQLTATKDCKYQATFFSSANVADGSLSHNQELFSAAGMSLAAGMTIYYDSLAGYSGPLGTGWSHSYDMGVEEGEDGSVIFREGSGVQRTFASIDGAYVGQPGDYASLVKNGDGTFALRERDGKDYRFDSNGRIAVITDRNGNATTFAYTNGNLTTVTDPAGRITTLAYDVANHLAVVTDPAGNAYSFTITGDTLTSVTNPDGGKWLYSYDDNAYMLTKTDPNGNIITYSYDSEQRIVSGTDPDGRTKSVTYPADTDSSVKTTAFTEADGGVWSYTYDTEKGILTQKVDPRGGVTSYIHDENRNVLVKTDPDGSNTSYSYDSAGNMTSTTDALGQTTSYTYNAFGQVLTIKDPQGGVTSYTYDSTGNMTAMTDPTGATTQYQYDVRGNVTKVTNPLGQATIFVYNAAGNLTSTTDPAGAMTSFMYDATGTMTSQANANGATTRFEYDARNRLVKATDPQGNVTTYTYDANGNKTSQTDANGNVTRYEYNTRGQVVKVNDALGNATMYTYGGSGCASCGGGTDKLTSLTDANGNATSYQYDTLGRLLSETDPLGNTTSYAYDAKGNLIAKTDANGATIKYTYDSLGRLLKKTYPDATEESYTYDSKGNMLTATNKNISYNYTYNAAGHVKSVTDSTGKVVSYEYDALGNKTKMISPEGKSLTYTYDSTNRLSTIINGGTFNLGYDSLGRRTSLAYPNGDTTVYSYDKQGRLTNLIHKNAAGAVIASNSYTLDKTGNRLSNTSQDRTISYQYDAIYRLTKALSNTPGNSSNTKATNGTTNATEQQKEFYTYDPVGNRLTSDKTKSYTYNQANQLVTNGGTYTYDKSGNLLLKMTSDGTTTYSWDYENRLVKVATATMTAEYAYNPFGKRIEKKVTAGAATETTRYFYDDQTILFEYDEIGTIGNRYIHGPGIDEPLMLNTGKDKYYYHADGLGSIIAFTDATGKAVQTYEYDSYGNMKDQKNHVKQPYVYTGREWDMETGLYYYRARYYDPMEGRFISKDPIGFDGGINIYAYTFNNPIRFTDPFGLDSAGCDNVPDFLETPCRLECCAKHDECFDNNKCTASSWLKDCPTCNKCNQEVFDCFTKCGRSKKDDPNKPNYYCAKLHKYVNIPGDFPTVDAAVKACKSN